MLLDARYLTIRALAILASVAFTLILSSFNSPNIQVINISSLLKYFSIASSGTYRIKVTISYKEDGVTRGNTYYKSMT